MADCEQGFFKTGMTVLPENYPPDLDRRLEESEEMEDNENYFWNKRLRAKDGGSVGTKGKLTGVYRLIMSVLCHKWNKLTSFQSVT